MREKQFSGLRAIAVDSVALSALLVSDTEIFTFHLLLEDIAVDGRQYAELREALPTKHKIQLFQQGLHAIAKPYIGNVTPRYIISIGTKTIPMRPQPVCLNDWFKSTL
mmetsp:Transcript_876/g.1888  ORF Transcript_876/g.1888 Transcript_876/m.1888 type:complete len:108 (-) Transcript_876:1722-2045(-)